MRKQLKQRLAAVEDRFVDHIAGLPVIDYVGLSDYNDDEWEEVHHDTTCTVYRNRRTGDFRGVYCDRRTDEEIRAEGGNLEYV